MTRKRRRLVLVVVALGLLGGATALVLSAFQDSLVFFYSPSDVVAHKAPIDRRLRIGGLVEPGSYVKEKGGITHRFVVTDNAHEIKVVYSGILPDLFREGQGVVAEGKLAADGLFHADDVLAKHDEKYMPPEVAESLKKSGHWMGAK